MTDFNKKTDDAMSKLQMIEDAVAKSSGQFDDLRNRADDVFQTRVEELAAVNGVDINKAHAMAVDDPLAQRAYALSVELAERQDEAREGGGHMAAYVG